MKLFLVNKTDKTLIINFNGQPKTVYPYGKDTVICEKNNISMNLTTADNYSSDKYSEKAGYHLTHRFVTRSQYDFSLQDETTLELYVEAKKGDHFDSYQRVIPYCKDISFAEPIYTLKNEEEIKETFAKNKRFEDKVEKRADHLLKAYKVKETLSDIFVGLLALAVAAIIFATIWSWFSLKAAVITFAVLGLLALIAYRIIRRLLKGANKAVDRFFSSRFFEKAVDKASEKYEENFVNCKNMPENLYKDESSYFDCVYIAAVFKYSTRSV